MAIIEQTKRNNTFTYKDVLGDYDCIWFELRDMFWEGRKFLKWAKRLGCRWLSGAEIQPFGGTNFFHVAMHADGTLGYVSMYAFMARHYGNKDIPIIQFQAYITKLKK